MSALDVLADGARWLSAGWTGPGVWPFSTATIRVGVTGLSRAGKTAFLTSVGANLLARPSPRFALAPLGATDVPAFDEAAYLKALAADPPVWPDRTNAVSLLALTTTIPRGALPARQVRLEFLDYPGEWLIDLPLLGMSFEQWSRSVMHRLEAPDIASLTATFLGFVRGLPAKAAADEALAQAGAGLYRAMLAGLRDAGLAFLQPGRHLMPAPGPEPPWIAFFPHARRRGPGSAARPPVRRLCRCGAARSLLALVRGCGSAGHPRRCAVVAARGTDGFCRHQRCPSRRRRRRCDGSGHGSKPSRHCAICACHRASYRGSPSPRPRPITWRIGSAATSLP